MYIRSECDERRAIRMLWRGLPNGENEELRARTLVHTRLGSARLFGSVRLDCFAWPAVGCWRSFTKRSLMHRDLPFSCASPCCCYFFTRSP